jgi:hypothetical protein
MIGCGERTWIRDEQVLPHPKPASFYLSGTVVSSAATASEKTAVWRFTPDGRDGQPHDVGKMLSRGRLDPNLSVGPVSFEGRSPCVLVFAHALQLSAHDPALAPYGVWIGQAFGPGLDPGWTKRPSVQVECAGQPPVSWPAAANIAG